MHELPIIEAFGLHFDISTILMLIVTCTIVFVLAKSSVRGISVLHPGKLQNFMEWVVEFVQNLIGSTMDLKKGRAFLSLGLTLIMFIFISNMLGLPFGVITEHDKPFSLFGQTIVSEADIHEAAEGGDGHGEIHLLWWKSPTADLSVSMGLALMVILLSHYLGLRKNTRSYLAHYFKPNIAFFPINVIEQFSKLLTLGMRLFGNIYAGEVMIATILMIGAFGIVPLIIWQSFSIFVGAIQAFIFTVLSMVYISQTLESQSDH